MDDGFPRDVMMSDMRRSRLDHEQPFYYLAD